MIVRVEQSADADAIGQVVRDAFAGARHASGTEAAIVDALRQAGALTLSLVGEEAGEVVGHIAFSPITIGGATCGWEALGPVAVRPDRQGRRIGSRLIKAGLAELRARGVAGCVLLGNPAFYARFGFVADPALRYAGAPAAYFQRLVLAGPPAAGAVAFHPAFGAA